MYDIKNMNIWKAEEHKPELSSEFHKVEITELNLSVRSYNCLKRAGCNTIGDILALMDEEGQGLRRIRNLGSRRGAGQTVSRSRNLCDIASRSLCLH